MHSFDNHSDTLPANPQNNTHRAAFGEESSPASLGTITPEEARAELNRVLQSADFPATLRNRRFLSFIVERTVHDRVDGHGCVTAHDVATQVFGRPDDFNTMLDPIVRIEAGKLRRDLETYYLKSGRRNPLRIDVPRGGYVPAFRRQEPVPENAGSAPTVTGDLAADVAAELQRMVASPDFPATPRNRKFLVYAVEKELAGASEEITATLVATRVFARANGFDPNKDPIVRIEAGKLRRDLETYYLKSGQPNPLRISMPKGGYRPKFTYQ
jgi:adenylate cyclase